MATAVSKVGATLERVVGCSEAGVVVDLGLEGVGVGMAKAAVALEVVAAGEEAEEPGAGAVEVAPRADGVAGKETAAVEVTLEARAASQAVGVREVVRVAAKAERGTERAATLRQHPWLPWRQPALQALPRHRPARQERTSAST